MKLIEADDLLSFCERRQSWPGHRRLIEMLGEISPGADVTRSELESMFLAFCRRHDVRPPEVNAKVEGMEVDCLWKEERLIVELDGYEFHSGWASFQKDRARDMRLEEAGYRTRRITHRMLTNQSSMVLRWLRANVSPHDQVR